MTLEQALAFLAFAFVAAVTPGPSNVMITATGSAVGMIRGLPCVLGASLGMGLLLFFSALGLGELVRAQPMIIKVLNWGGAAFLLWMAWKIASAPVATATESAKPVGLIGAALFQWANPKGWLVAIGAASTYLQGAGEGHFLQALIFGVLFFLVAFPCGLLWLVLGAVINRILHNERQARIFNVTMGFALAASVVMLFR